MTFRTLTTALALIALSTGCMRSSDSNLEGNDDLDSTLGSLTDSGNGGSGAGGSLTPTDTAALSNLFTDAKANSPDDKAAAAAIAAKYQAMVEAKLKERRDAAELKLQLMQIAGQMLLECNAKVGGLAPVPGQPLLGTWETADPKAACKVKFVISGAGPLQQQTTNKYAVTGETQGHMLADAQGIGVVQGNPWTGNLRDTPQAGNGTLRHPSFTPATGGKNPTPAAPCDAAVAIKTSTNPIPANFDEMVDRLGCCFRSSLTMMSPTMVQMMSGMDPALASLLMRRQGCGAK